MVKYVKISTAKNLRFRLISVLYLLFISLSIIQIPIEWLHINPYLANYLRLIDVKVSNSNELSIAKNKIRDLDESFVRFLGFDDIKNSVNEPTGYSKTDEFFINQKNADSLFRTFESLRNTYLQMDSTALQRKVFEKLFISDLKNGLSDGQTDNWVDWKFKHVPATVVRAMLADYNLRLNLLDGMIEVKSKGNAQKSFVQMALNIDEMQMGDTAKFVILNKRDMRVSIQHTRQAVNSYFWSNDTLFFVPKKSGKYLVSMQSDSISEVINIDVKPRTFIREKGKVVQYFYRGKKAALKYNNTDKVLRAKCDCASNEWISYGDGLVNFTPQKSGWCNFQLFSEGGTRVLQDSIYVQDIPFPKILVVNASSNKISKARLSQEKGFRITAMHPKMDNFNYNVKNVKVTLIGIDNKATTYQGAMVPLSMEQLEMAKYIQINEVVVQTTVKNFTIQEPLIIEII